MNRYGSLHKITLRMYMMEKMKQSKILWIFSGDNTPALGKQGAFYNTLSYLKKTLYRNPYNLPACSSTGFKIETFSKCFFSPSKDP